MLNAFNAFLFGKKEIICNQEEVHFAFQYNTQGYFVFLTFSKKFCDILKY